VPTISLERPILTVPFVAMGMAASRPHLNRETSTGAIGSSGRATGDSEVSQLSSPLKCLMPRTIAAEESVTGD